MTKKQLRNQFSESTVNDESEFHPTRYSHSEHHRVLIPTLLTEEKHSDARSPYDPIYEDKPSVSHKSLIPKIPRQLQKQRPVQRFPQAGLYFQQEKALNFQKCTFFQPQGQRRTATRSSSPKRSQLVTDLLKTQSANV